MIKYFYVLSVAIMLVALSSCKQTSKKNKEKPPAVVDLLIAGHVNIPSNVEVNGVVLSEEMIEMHPEISGRITYLNIPDGASVQAGTVLARINDADIQAQIEQQKVQLEISTKTEQRLKKLLSLNGVNQADYDAALSQVNSYNASIKVLNAQLDKTVIKAPFTGVLGLRMVSLGAYVTPQTIIGTLQQADKVKIDFSVPETYASLISIGSQVQIKTNTGDEKYTAVISAVEPQVNVDTRNIKVRARLKSGSISPGSFVKVTISKENQGIVVPSNAIIPDASSNQVVVIKNNKAVFVAVETGIRTADLVELTSGVNKGDSIVVSGVLFVRPNAEVKVRIVKTNVQ